VNEQPPQYQLKEPTAAAIRAYLAGYRNPAGKLVWMRARRIQLERDGLYKGLTLAGWDDYYHNPIRNGHDRTPLHLGFDLLATLEGFNETGQSIFWMAGPPGLGKTHLAKLLVHYYCLLNNKVGRYVNWKTFLALYKDSFDDHNAHVSAAPYYKADALVLDDVSAGFTTWELQQFYNLIEGRAGNDNDRSRKNLTIITSNRELRQAYTTTIDERDVTITSFQDALFQPQRRQDQQNADYSLVAVQVWDRIRPSVDGGRYTIAEVAIDADHTYEEYNAKKGAASDGAS